MGVLVKGLVVWFGFGVLRGVGWLGKGGRGKWEKGLVGWRCLVRGMEA